MSVSAKASQMVTVVYPGDVPTRRLYGKPYSTYKPGVEITLTTEQAVSLYNQLKEALFA